MDMEGKVLVEWVKEVNKELVLARKDIHDYNMKSYKHAQGVETKLLAEIGELREEFKIHKTKVNQRTAVIATVFSAIVAGAGLLYSALRISEFIK